jgi:hypothetical protein
VFIAYRDKKVVGVFVRFRAKIHHESNSYFGVGEVLLKRATK